MLNYNQTLPYTRLCSKTQINPHQHLYNYNSSMFSYFAFTTEVMFKCIYEMTEYPARCSCGLIESNIGSYSNVPKVVKEEIIDRW